MVDKGLNAISTRDTSHSYGKSIRIESLDNALQIRRPLRSIISFLDPNRGKPVPTFSLSQESHEVFEFHDVIGPTEGYVEPTLDDAMRWISAAEAALARGGELLIHCHLGLSRSVAAGAVAAYLSNTVSIADIPRWLLRNRPRAWPNSLMLRHADEVLNTGRLLSEIGAFTRRLTYQNDPEWVMTLAKSHRHSEVWESVEYDASSSDSRIGFSG